MKRTVALLVLVVLINGCATNPFKTYYRDNTRGDDYTKNPTIIISNESPKLLSGNNPDEDNQRLAEDGYVCIGYSSFNGRQASEKLAIDYGRTIHAALILYYSKYTNTESGVMPFTLPDTRTTVTQATGNAYASGNVQGSGVISGPQTTYNTRMNGMYSGMTTATGTTTSTTYGTKTTYIPYSVNKFDYLVMNVNHYFSSTTIIIADPPLVFFPILFDPFSVSSLR